VTIEIHALQILAKIGARTSAEKIIPLLQDEQPNVRIMAANSVARLRCVTALPELEAALKNLPDQQADSYQVAIRRGIAELKQPPETGGP
jgi:HEAT repeat protein